MTILNDLRKEIEEIEDAKELSERVKTVFKIAKAVSKLELSVSYELVFKAAVQAELGKLEL